MRISPVSIPEEGAVNPDDDVRSRSFLEAARHKAHMIAADDLDVAKKDARHQAEKCDQHLVDERLHRGGIDGT